MTRIRITQLGLRKLAIRPSQLCNPRHLHQQRTMSTPAIAIIGSGPCGLTLARLLENKHISYVIYERDESEALSKSRVSGSLDLDPKSGQRAVQACGLWDEFVKKARYEDTVFAVADKSGKKLLEFGQGRDTPEINRDQLRKLFLDAIPKERSKWGYGLDLVSFDDEKKPVLEFANGEKHSGFKLVVGADGANSKVRPAVRASSSRLPDTGAAC
jgi:2-polyprenyl-6-methoxyphenol hydroxylase-like FAD-dependent oxidoreductase